MTKKKETGQKQERITEADVYKSFTHERPDPKTKPPTEKPKQTSTDDSSK